MAAPTVVFCHCANANVVSQSVKDGVRAGLQAAGVAFTEVPDLCELAARKDPWLQQIARSPVRLAACYPRAVRWLFAAADASLAPSAEICNMRTETAEAILPLLIGGPPAAPPPEPEPTTSPPSPPSSLRWKPWFPVIDFDRCTHCMQCLSFCLFDVYGVDAHKKITVAHPANCKTDCPACSRVCPEVAIVFPKYPHAPINGDAIAPEDVQREKVKVDLSALLGGDIYSALRQRSERAKSRFSKERDEDKALAERRRCLEQLKNLDIPPEVLAALPSLEEIRAKAAAKGAQLP